MLLNPGAHNEPISSSLICTSLYNSAVAYEALSYTWGDHRHREEISLVTLETGERIEYVLAVTSSLHSALKSLRPQTGPARTLWIDAICINQADLDERSSQVARMREIYHKANMVIVWLGDGNEATQKSLMTIRAISHRYERLGRAHVEEEN
jgi:hypothetical protein